MSVLVVARRYAAALLELGVESGQLEAISSDFSKFAETYQASADLRGAVENPLVAHAAKKAVVFELAEKLGVHAIVKNTLGLMVDRRRMKTLPYVARYLRELSDAKKGLLRAEVTTATQLSDDYYARLQAQLEKLTGKKVALERTIDPSIISGVVTRIGDRVFDGSVRSRLASLKDALMPHPN